MQTLGTIREFQTKNFTVKVDAVEDYDVDLSWDEDGSVIKGLESGKYIAFAVRARVLLNGNEVASDYLGGCIYESLEDFMDHKLCGRETRKLRESGSTAICGSYFSDMVRNVCEEARNALNEQRRIYIRH